MYPLVSAPPCRLIYFEKYAYNLFCFKVEFAVQMSGPGCAQKVQNCLKDVGTVDIDILKGSVVVSSELPWIEIQEKIEKTGRKAVLSGFGGKISHCWPQNFSLEINYGNLFDLQKHLLLLS